MTDRTIACGRCGATNVGGDQFCGSCGAFLEWVGGPADATPPQVGPVAPDADAGAPEKPAVDTRPEVPAAPEDLVRCPACGIANPATRTFCQTCGARLDVAPRASAVGRDWVGLPAAPTPPGRPNPPALERVGAATARTSGRAGGPSWLVVAVLGVVVGAAVVGGALILGPGSSPTIAPSGPGSPIASSPVSASGSTPASTPSTSVGAGVPITLDGASASSVVEDRPAFDAMKAIDHDRRTAWQEGAATEAGQWIEVRFAPVERLDAVLINNGFQLSVAAWGANRRLRDVLITVDEGAPIAVRLKDETKAQRIDLGGIAGATRVRIEIVTTYASKKTSYPGSPFDQAAVSEIVIVGVPGT